MSHAGTLFSCLALAAAVVVLNVPTWDYGFVYDDQAVIVERAPAWEQGWGEFLGSRHWGTGRHAVLLSFDLNRPDPLSPRPFHIVNTALAAIAPVLLFALARALGIASAAAFAGALLFAVHPVHVDAVVSIVGRAELLAGVAVLGCLLLHARGYPRPALSIPGAALLLFVGAASKESALTAWLLLLAYDVLLSPRGSQSAADRRTRAAAYGAYAIATVAWLALVGRNLDSLGTFDYVDNPLAFMPALERIVRAAAVLWRYLAAIVLPVDLKPDRGYAETDPTMLEGAVGLAAWIVVLAVCWRARRTHPRTVFATTWFLLSFALTANVAFPIGQIMAERLAYLPSAGVALLAALLVENLAARGRVWRATLAAVSAIAVIVLSFAYDARARVWTNERHYHFVTAIESPRSAKAHYNLGLERARAGDWDAAEAALRRALAIRPEFPLAAYYLAGVHLERKQPARAAAVFEAYLRLAPDDQGALSQLVTIQMMLDRFEEANVTAKRLVALEPRNPGHAALLDMTEAALRALEEAGLRSKVSP